VLWSGSFGGTRSDSGSSITSDPQGNVWLTGYFSGSVTFGGNTHTSAGANDLFVLKLDPSGTVLWSGSFGGTSSDRGSSITSDPQGNVWLTGSFTGSVSFGGNTHTSAGGTDLFVLKLAPSGTVLWSGSFGDTYSDHGHSITSDPQGNVWLTGYYGGYALFALKLAPSGTVLWSGGFGGWGYDSGNSITSDPQGDIWLTGDFSQRHNFGGDDLVSQSYSNLYTVKLHSGRTAVQSQFLLSNNRLSSTWEHGEYAASALGIANHRVSGLISNNRVKGSLALYAGNPDPLADATIPLDLSTLRPLPADRYDGCLTIADNRLGAVISNVWPGATQMNLLKSLTLTNNCFKNHFNSWLARSVHLQGNYLAGPEETAGSAGSLVADYSTVFFNRSDHGQTVISVFSPGDFHSDSGNMNISVQLPPPEQSGS
jgi:hypothetical protein